MQIDSHQWKELVSDGAKQLGAPLTEKQLEQFFCHASEMLLWNKTFNVTAITDPDEIAIKHFVDSVAAAKFFTRGQRVLDMGAGAGFPGLPLAVMLPDVHFLLIEASRKKASFLNQAIRKMGLPNAKALHIRAQELAKTEKEAFDAVTARALADLENLWKLAAPFLASGKALVALKGKHNKEEVQNFLANCDTNKPQVEIHTYHLPVIKQTRAIVVVRKS